MTPATRIQVITLPRTPARFSAFLQHNDMPDLDIVRIKAVDGAVLDRAGLISAGVVAADLIFTDLSVGCALSHIECWRRAAAGSDAMTICEDDAVLRRDFAVVQRRLLATQPDFFDLIYWGFNFDMHVELVIPGIGPTVAIFDQAALHDGSFQASAGVPTLYPARRVWGALCYTVSPSGAQKLLAACLPLRNESATFRLASGVGPTPTYRFTSLGIDMTMGIAHLATLDAWLTIPPLAVSMNDKATSTIGTGARTQVPLEG